MRLTLWLALGLATAACRAEAPTSGTAKPVTAKARALDGDTVSIDIRLLGADAFEKRQLCRAKAGCWPCGKVSQNFTSRLMKQGNATIRLTDTQSYGRPVGTISIDGKDLGETLIAAGLAVPAAQYLKDDPSRARRYVSAYVRRPQPMSARTAATSSRRLIGGMASAFRAKHGPRVVQDGADPDTLFGMLRTQVKRDAQRGMRDRKRLADIETSIVALDDDDLLDLADIFQRTPETPIARSAASEMMKRGISL
ncbi:MAG: thermonuclease family protein [Rhizorhabdus sp.]